MDSVNAKKRWTTIYWRVNKFLKESHLVTRLAKERATFLKINDISFFGTPDCHCCSTAKAEMLILCDKQPSQCNIYVTNYVLYDLTALLI
jgi:hypothetical protein